MNSMRILLVDDEALARERLRRLLARVQGVQIVGEAADGLQAVEMVERLDPDLVLLDVQMPGLDGFGVIQALEDPPAVIFVTAYDEYAIRAFEVHALDYLLKPFSQDRLEEALQRARETLGQEREPSAQLDSLLESLAAEGQYLSRLAVHEGERIRILAVEEVDWVGIEEEQVVVHVGDQMYPIRRTLTDLEARLDPERFFRAHRSAIVNLDRVQEVVPWFKGSYILRLTTGAEVDLSRARGRALRKMLGW